MKLTRLLRAMRISTFSLICLTSITACQIRTEVAMTENPSETLNQVHLNSIDTLITDAIQQKITPGAVVNIGTGDNIYLCRAFGNLTYEENAPSMTEATIFDLASVSKVVGTATATMLLIEDGKLTLQDKVAQYIPGFDADEKRNITIYNLLTHTSGLEAYVSVKRVEQAADPSLTPHENLIAYISKMPLKYETGKGYTYSCLNYLTLAYVNQKVLGHNQDIFLKKRVYQPLGMKDTTYYLTDEQMRRTAPTIGGTEFRQGKVHDPLAYYSVSNDYSPGNAGLFSTAPDLAKYCSMILNQGKYKGIQIMQPGTVILMTTPQMPEAVNVRRAIGFGISESFPWATSLNQALGHEVASHTGYTGTLIRIDKYANNYLVLLTNRCYPDDKQQVTKLREAVIKTLVECSPLYKDITPETKPSE